MQRRERLTFREKGSVLLVILGCMNFRGDGSLILLLFSIFVLLSTGFRVRLGWDAVPVGLLMVFIAIASAIHYETDEIIKAATFFLLYVAGRAGYQNSLNKTSYIERSLFSVFAGFALELIIFRIYNIDKEKPTVRSFYSAWTGELIAVTLLALLASVLIGYSFYAFFAKRNRWVSLIVLGCLINGLTLSSETATRTPFAVFIVVYAVMGIIYVFDKKGARAIRSIIFVAIAIGIFAAIYALDVGGIRTAIEEMPVYDRLLRNGFKSSRGNIAREYMRYMLDYPWGGGHVQAGLGIAPHNYLQQTYDMYGVFAFAAMCMVTIQFVRNFLQLAGIKKKKPQDFLFLSMYLAMSLQMCVEPVMTGYPILLWSLLYIHGIATDYLEDRKQETKMGRQFYEDRIFVQFPESSPDTSL